jgi:integrase
MFLLVGLLPATGRHNKATRTTVERTTSTPSDEAPIRLYHLRHTHATLALQAGVHPKVVSERLGNATVSITLDTCSHAIPAMHEDAAALIAGLVLSS